jgi:DNA-binding NtrC family response regulator
MEVALEQIDLRSISSQSVEAALMLMRGPEIAIIISDIRLGGTMDGIDFAREVKSRWPKLPFVITSGTRAQDWYIGLQTSYFYRSLGKFQIS